MKIWHWIKNRLTYVRIITIGYIFVTLLGTVLLLLPPATVPGRKTDLGTAFFTAASSACVTGLMVVDPGTHFSLFGQIVILALIQIGGLGFVSVCVMLSLLLKKKITLKARGLLQESMNGMQIGGIVKVVKLSLIGTFLFELAGALLLAIKWIPALGVGQGIFYSVFHAVSAFCNAGIELFGPYFGEYSSLSGFRGDVLVNFVMIVLTIAGGIGFFVWADFLQEKMKLSKCMLHTKMVLMMSGILLAVGTILYFIFENQNSFADMGMGEKLMSALFCATMTRTTGFSMVGVEEFSGASKLLTIVLSFIGGSPGSTAGGIKTVTVMVLVLYIWSNLSGKRDVTIFKRSLDNETMQRASNVLVLSLMLAIGSWMFICYRQPELAVLDVLIEVTSAIGTAGMSTGITRELQLSARVVIIILMYCGRIGSMSFALSIVNRKKEPPLRQPIEKIMIG